MKVADPASVDAEVLEHLRRGEKTAAVTRALTAYGEPIQDFVFSILRDESATEEAFAQFSEDLWRGIEHFRGDCAFRTYAYQLAHNAACRYAKDPFRRRGRRLETSELGRVPARAESTMRRNLQRQEGLDRLREELAPDEQALLTLRVDHEMPWREIAQILSSSDEPAEEAALRKRYERLKARLRDLARKEGLLRGPE